MWLNVHNDKFLILLWMKYFSFLVIVLISHCVSAKSIITDNKTTVDRIEIVFKFTKIEGGRDFFDTVLVIQSEKEKEILLNIIDTRIKKFKLCTGKCRIDYRDSEKSLFSIRFGLKCDFAQLLYDESIHKRRSERVYPRMTMTKSAKKLLEQYKNTILNQIGKNWYCL